MGRDWFCFNPLFNRRHPGFEMGNLGIVFIPDTLHQFFADFPAAFPCHLNSHIFRDKFALLGQLFQLFFTLDNAAIILQVPFQKLHLVGGTVGGGFGGKVDVIVEPISALAAMKTNRPVKYMFSRQEEMQASSSRGAWRMYYKDGVTKDGRIVARKITTYADAGAYNRHTPYAVTKHAANVAGPYAIPNVRIDAHCVYTNRQPGSAMRGFAVTPASFALEVQMDKIAKTLDKDPWEIRFLNAYRNGDMKPHRKVVEDATLIETMQAAAEMVGHELPKDLKAMSSNDRKGGTNG